MNPPKPGVRKRQILLGIMPIIINIIFGEPFFFSIYYQRWFTIVIISLYLIYLTMLLIYLIVS